MLVVLSLMKQSAHGSIQALTAADHGGCSNLYKSVKSGGVLNSPFHFEVCGFRISGKGGILKQCIWSYCNMTTMCLCLDVFHLYYSYHNLPLKY